MSLATRRKLIMALVPLFLLTIITQWSMDPKIREIHKGEHNVFAGLSNEFILGPMLGLSQAVAGLLWIRADEFFDQGDYDAILPIVRMVTWLDPHQLDVYITGAWHMSYNFTDSDERSDRRYIPAAQKLLEEGDANNPAVYDIAFEIGWESSDKMKDYVRAEKWYRIATTRKAQDAYGNATQPPPLFVWHQLAHSLERQGRIDEAVQVWRKVLAMSNARLAQSPKDFNIRNLRDTEEHNMNLDLERKFSRYTHEVDWTVDKQQTRSINQVTGEPSPPNAYIATHGPNAGKPRPPAILPPWNCEFNAHPVFIQPKVLMPNGQFNVGDGARVMIRLADEDYHEKKLKKFDFNIDQSQTIMVDYHSVIHGKWGRKIDMSKDPKMYSFSRDYYYLVFEFDPRETSPFIQDKFGWSGEGMTDAHYLYIQKHHIPQQPDDRILLKVYKISRQQVLGEEPITEKDVVPNAKYEQIMESR
jgi:tetratricopeptide (TPR) repeat protein